MDNNTLGNFEKQIVGAYKKENLVALQDNQFTYKGINVLDISNVPRLSTSKVKNYNSMKNTWDIINCNTDLRFFTALLFLYRPYINNPGYENVIHNGKIIYTYYQSTQDHRYSQYASICYEKLYNFCDRIGDLLDYHFHEIFLNQKRTYFANVIEELKKDPSIKANTYFKEILKYKNTLFKEINKERIEIVHYYQFETNYRYHFTRNCTNELEIRKMWNFKSSLPEYFKKHLDLSNGLFYNTFKFLTTYKLPNTAGAIINGT